MGRKKKNTKGDGRPRSRNVRERETEFVATSNSLGLKIIIPAAGSVKSKPLLSPDIVDFKCTKKTTKSVVQKSSTDPHSEPLAESRSESQLSLGNQNLYQSSEPSSEFQFTSPVNNSVGEKQKYQCQTTVNPKSVSGNALVSEQLPLLLEASIARAGNAQTTNPLNLQLSSDKNEGVTHCVNMKAEPIEFSISLISGDNFDDTNLKQEHQFYDEIIHAEAVSFEVAKQRSFHTENLQKDLSKDHNQLYYSKSLLDAGTIAHSVEAETLTGAHEKERDDSGVVDQSNDATISNELDDSTGSLSLLMPLSLMLNDSSEDNHGFISEAEVLNDLEVGNSSATNLDMEFEKELIRIISPHALLSSPQGTTARSPSPSPMIPLSEKDKEDLIQFITNQIPELSAQPSDNLTAGFSKEFHGSDTNIPNTDSGYFDLLNNCGSINSLSSAIATDFTHQDDFDVFRQRSSTDFIDTMQPGPVVISAEQPEEYTPDYITTSKSLQLKKNNEVENCLEESPSETEANTQMSPLTHPFLTPPTSQRVEEDKDINIYGPHGCIEGLNENKSAFLCDDNDADDISVNITELKLVELPSTKSETELILEVELKQVEIEKIIIDKQNALETISIIRQCKEQEAPMKLNKSGKPKLFTVDSENEEKAETQKNTNNSSKNTVSKNQAEAESNLSAKFFCQSSVLPACDHNNPSSHSRTNRKRKETYEDDEAMTVNMAANMGNIDMHISEPLEFESIPATPTMLLAEAQPSCSKVCTTDFHSSVEMAMSYNDPAWSIVNVSPKLQVKENPGEEQIQFELQSSTSAKKMLISVSKDQRTTSTDSLDYNLDCLKIQVQSESHSQLQSQFKLSKENSSVITTNAARIASLKFNVKKGKNSIKERMLGRGQAKNSLRVSGLVQEPLPLGVTGKLENQRYQFMYNVGHKAYLYGNGRFVVDRKDLKSTVKEIIFWRIVKATNQVLLQKFVPVKVDERDMHRAVGTFLSFEKTDPSFYHRFQPIIFHLTNDKGTLGYHFDLGAGSVPYFGYFELTDKYFNDFQLFLRKMTKRALQDEVPSNWSSSIEGSSVIRDLLKEIYEKSCFATLLPSDFMECVMEYPEILKTTTRNVNRDKKIQTLCEFCQRIGKIQKLNVEFRMVFFGDPYNLDTLMLKPSSDQPRPRPPDYQLCQSCGSMVKALHRLIHYPYSLFIAFRLQLKQLYSLLKPGESYKAQEVFNFLLEDPHFNRMTFYEWQAAHGEGIHFYKRCDNKVNKYSALISSQNLKRTQGKKGKQAQLISMLPDPGCTHAGSNAVVALVSETPMNDDTSSSVPKSGKKRSQSEISVTAREKPKVSRKKSLLSVRPNPNLRKPRQKLGKSSETSSSIFKSGNPTGNLTGANNISITMAETAKNGVCSKNSNIQKRNPRTKGKSKEIAPVPHNLAEIVQRTGSLEKQEKLESSWPPLKRKQSYNHILEYVDFTAIQDPYHTPIVEPLMSVPPLLSPKPKVTSIFESEHDPDREKIVRTVTVVGANSSVSKNSNVEVQLPKDKKNKAVSKLFHFTKLDVTSQNSQCKVFVALKPNELSASEKPPLAVSVTPEPNELSTSEKPLLAASVAPEPNELSTSEKPPLAVSVASETNEISTSEKPLFTTSVAAEPNELSASDKSPWAVSVTPDPNELSASKKPPLAASVASEPNELSASEKPPLAVSVAPEPNELASKKPPLAASVAPEPNELSASKEPALSVSVAPEPNKLSASDKPTLAVSVAPDPNELSASKKPPLAASVASEPNELSASEKPPLAVSVAPEPNELCHSLSASKTMHNVDHQSPPRVDSALAPDPSQNSMVEPFEPASPSIITAKSVATSKSEAEDDTGIAGIVSAIVGDGKNVGLYQKNYNNSQRQKSDKNKAKFKPLNFLNEDIIPSSQKTPSLVFVAPEPDKLCHNLSNPKRIHSCGHQNLESVDFDVVQDSSQVVTAEPSKPTSPSKPNRISTPIANSKNDTVSEGIESNSNGGTKCGFRNSNKTKVQHKKATTKQDFSKSLNSVNVDIALSPQPLLTQPVAPEPNVLSHNVSSPKQMHISDRQSPKRIGSTGVPESSPNSVIEPFEPVPQLMIKPKHVVKSGVEADYFTGSSGSASITSANVGGAANVFSSKKKYTETNTLGRKKNRTHKEIRHIPQNIQHLDHIMLSSQALPLAVSLGPEAEELQLNFKISAPTESDNCGQKNQNPVKWPIVESTRVEQDLTHNLSECLKPLITGIQKIRKRKLRRSKKISGSKKSPARKIISRGTSVSFERTTSAHGSPDSETVLLVTSATATVDSSSSDAVASRSLVENNEDISSSIASDTNNATTSQSSPMSSADCDNVVLPSKISYKNQFSQENKINDDIVNKSTSTPSQRNPTTVRKADFKTKIPVIILKRVDEDDRKNDQTRIIEGTPKGKVEVRILLTRIEEDQKLQSFTQRSVSSSSHSRILNSRDTRSETKKCNLKSTTDDDRVLEMEPSRFPRRSLKKRVPYSPSRLGSRERLKRVVVPGELHTAEKSVQAKGKPNFKTIGASHDCVHESQVMQGHSKLKSKPIKQQHFSQAKEIAKSKAKKKALIVSEIKRTIELRNGNKIPGNHNDSFLTSKKKKR